MANGTVKFFNAKRGFGFITPEEGGQDMFVHISALEASGLKSLNDNDKVSYDVSTEKGKPSAVNIKKI